MEEVRRLSCSGYLWFLTYGMLGFPLVYLVFASMIFEFDSKGVLSVILSPLFWLSCGTWMAAGIGIRRMRHWSWYTFLGAQFFSTYLNLLNLLQYSESRTKGLAFISTLIIQFYVYLVVARDIRVPYLFPRIKWWESGLAAMHHLLVQVDRPESGEKSASSHLLDMNMKGCFVKSPLEFKPFEKVRISINAYGQKIVIPGEVVWRADSTVTHPKGVGIKFSDVDRTRKRRVRAVVRRFIKEREKENARSPVSV